MSGLFRYTQKGLRAAGTLLILIGIVLPSLHVASAQDALAVWPSEWQADSAFYNLWSRADAPVAMNAAARSWLWGPLPFAVANEDYQESPTGKRLVQYFDKGRMEVNDPGADRTSQWFVSSGLLVNEMVTGRVQTGNARFEVRAPADGVVAGDPDSPGAPTYASFASHTAQEPDATGNEVSQKIAKDGTLSPYSPQSDADLFKVAYYDATTGHNVPTIFVSWLSQSGTVLEGGQLVQDQVIDALFVLGRPITGAFWADVRVNGAPVTVLVQLFERRVLTYNPTNAPEWRVEMGNVGRAYYDWRYKSSAPGPAISAEVRPGELAVRGWNWPASSTVAVRIGPAGVNAPVVSSTTPAGSSGFFSLPVQYDQALQDALSSGSSLQVRATSGSAQTALPLAGKPPSGKVEIAGIVTFIDTTGAVTSLAMRSLDGELWRVSLPAGAAITGSEGTSISPAALTAGAAGVVDGTVESGTVSAGSIKLLSESATGARVSYSWSADGKSIFVSGTGWPGETDVTFSMGLPGGAQSQFAKMHADSSGNLSDSIQGPPQNPGQPSQWLFASSAGASGPAAQVAIPLATLGSVAAPPATQLYITSQKGSQAGQVGSYCARGKCFSAPTVPLPGEALSVKPGDLLALRQQNGTAAIINETPTRISTQLHSFPATPGEAPDASLSFVPAGTPIYSSGDLPGRPFSVSLPQSLAAGRYALIVSISWPDNGGGANRGLYGFLLQVP
jgi:hypothetical protein